ncbi:MAG: VIT and VWA domain-containing protein [Deltaproteobacteria bacterium]|nr:VIT and VWA domain-containing protein [Deltaproteobacteria bacterium]
MSLKLGSPLLPVNKLAQLRLDQAIRPLVVCFVTLLGLLVLGLAGSQSLTAQESSEIAEKTELSIARPPRPETPYEVVKTELIFDVTRQKAMTILRQTIKNTGQVPLEMDYMVPLPLNGTVNGLTLVSNGKEMVGEVLDKAAAWEIYQSIVSRLKDPALLEYAGRGMFRSRIFPIDPGKESTLDLSIDYLLPKEDGRVDINFPLAGSLTNGRKIGLQEIIVKIDGDEAGGFYSPLGDLDVKSDGSSTTLTYAVKDAEPLRSFQLSYREEADSMGGLILSHRPDPSEDGYFLFLAEPSSSLDSEPIMAKTVVFCLDVSGSMSGHKIVQAKAALNFVLDRLNPEDSFDLVEFSSRAKAWRPELEAMNEENRLAAKNYVKSLREGGSTNISEALAKSLSLVTGTNPSYLIFLTDGEATIGEMDERKLVQISRENNPNQKTRIFSFGLGHDVNARLLDALAIESRGQATFVGVSEDIEEKVSSFFSKMAYPALIKPELKINRQVNRLLPAALPDLFRGSQLVLVGRYAESGEAAFSLTGLEGEKEVRFEYKANLADGPVEGGEFIARLWAQRRIAEIIEEIDQSQSSQPNKELVEELTGLSKRYGIMTPYTSFLAVESEMVVSEDQMRQRTADNLAALDGFVGEAANAQREAKGILAASPRPEQTFEEMEQFQSIDKYAAPGSVSLPEVLGNRVFFRKADQLIESSLTENDLKNVQTVTQFSPEYFELAQKMPAEDLIVLTRKETVVFQFQGVNYQIKNS